VTWAGIRTVLGVSASVLVIVFCASFAVTAIAQGQMYGAGTPADGADWSDYPGTAWIDAQAVLDDPSEEETIAASAELNRDIRDAVAAEFDVDWSAGEPGPPTVTGNGYGEDSMLHNWSGEQWRGVITGAGAGAGERIQEIVDEVGAEHGADDYTLYNDLEATDKQRAELYGAAEPDGQATWEGALDGGPHPTHSIFARVHDTSLSTVPGYTGWIPRDSSGTPVDTSAPAVYISLSSSANRLLPGDDRAEYEERLADYAGLEKPEGEY
jgi:hypothetical protein